jgi:hypothetical protein
MNLNLKITSKLIVEAALIDNNNNVELLGIQPLCEAYEPFKFAIRNKTLTNDCSFSNNFSESDCFFYSLQQVRKNNVIKYEHGIGRLKKDNKRFFLVREIPISYGDDKSQSLCTNGCETFSCSDCDHIIAQASLPKGYAECLYSDNVLISSSAPFLPLAVKVEPNSIVGRLDSNISSIAFEDLCSNKNFSEELISLLKKYNKQIALQSPKVNIKKIQTNCVQFDNSGDVGVKKNSLVLQDNVLKFYDGSNWYKVNMEPIE